MIRYRWLVALTSVASFVASAGAAVLGPAPSAAARGWIEPIAGAFTEAGTNQVAALGSLSLANLASLESPHFLFAQQSGALAPLAAEFAAGGLSPRQFAGLPTDKKLAALKTAASSVEAKAAALVDTASAQADAGLTVRNYPSVSATIDAAQNLALYVDPARRRKINEARRIRSAFETRWQRQMENFNAELPAKLRAGSFDAEAILQATPEGWVAADESPAPRESLAWIYQKRIAELEGAAKGPWTDSAARALRSALERPDVAAALASERVDAATLRPRLDAILFDWTKTLKQNPALAGALSAFRQNAVNGARVPLRHFKTLETFYEAALNSHAAPSIETRRFVSISEGEAGSLPSWSVFKKLRAAAATDAADKSFRRARSAWSAAGGPSFIFTFRRSSGRIFCWPY